MEQHSDSDSDSWRFSPPPRTTPPIIDRRVLPSGEVEEWERTSTIPDDFIYDPETHSYYPPGEPVDWDIEGQMREFEEARRRGDFKGGLISRDQLLAAGAIVSPKKRGKLLGRRSNRQLDLFGDADTDNADQAASDDEDAE